METMRCVYLSLLFVLVGYSKAFNIDINDFVKHVSDQEGSMFGYAVAQYKYQGDNRLLVGAPRFEGDQKRRGIDHGGAVISCSADTPGDCKYVAFDRTGNNRHDLGAQLENKSNQWFGATVKTSGADGIVVACAPLYVWFTENVRRREPVGTCYVARRGLTDFEEYSPCRTRQWGYHRQGSCQAGFDAVITDDSSRLYIGAPGAYYWQGQIHSQSLSTKTDYHMTYEGPPTEDDQYLGYSAAVGDFNGDGIQDVALGVPKGLNYTGKIALYSHDLTPLQNLTGYQLGSYFGYCLAVVDFNHDGMDDIVVGAPMYTDYTDQEMKFEVGRVHVLLQNRARRFPQVITFNGKINRGRFGMSVTKLADINMDGIDDVAVGAPYGGPDGNGAVFIYHGFEIRRGELITEEMKKASQVIYASDIDSGISTFGWSLSGGLDMDNNLYPDLLVGSYASDSAVLLKSRPVVNLFNHTLGFLSESKSIKLEADGESGCLTPSGDLASCVFLEFCIGYIGIGLPSDLELFVEYKLDGKVNEPRLFFVSNAQQKYQEHIQMERELTTCTKHEVYVRKTLTDKLTPMGAAVTYSLVEPRYRRGRRSLTPVLNQRQKLSLSDSITIQKNCGPDNVCIPDLILSFTAPEKHISDRLNPLEVDIRVTNNGEDAFEAKVYVPIPPGLSFKRIMEKDNTSVICSPRTNSGNVTVVCEIGNPLPWHNGVHFGILFEQYGDPVDSQFEFLVTANSTNAEEERTREDNIILKTVIVGAETQLELHGFSDPENILYNTTLYNIVYKKNEKHLGPQVTHRYGLSNAGPSNVMESEIVILWPTKTENGNYLLYLLEQPETKGPIKCSLVPDVNPMNLRLAPKKKSGAELLKSEGHEDSLKEVQIEADYSEETHVSGTAYGGAGGREAGSAGSSSSTSWSSETHYSSSGDGGSESSSSSSSTKTYSSSSSSGTYSSSSSSSTSSGYDEGYVYSKVPVRRRRQAGEPLDWESEIKECGPTNCTQIRCTVGFLAEEEGVYVYIRSRLVVDTLKQYPFEDVTISSKMVARVKRLQYGINPAIIPVRSLEVSTPVSPAKSLDEAPPIPWWVIVLATMAGVLILLIIILILWKCGYFRRNRPEDNARGADDAQPLNPPNGHNGNGHNYSPYSRPYYPGDEAL